MVKGIVNTLNGIVESLVLVLLTEISEDSFVVVTHLSENTSHIISFLVSMSLLNGLVYLFAVSGDHYLKSSYTKNSLEILVAVAFFLYAIYNIFDFLKAKDQYPSPTKLLDE